MPEPDAPRTLSIIIPAYNEAATISLILDQIRAVQLIGGIQKQVIVVDDCSRDTTPEVIRQYAATHPEMLLQYHRHAMNQGKGAALHTWYPRGHRRLHYHSGCGPGV